MKFHRRCGDRVTLLHDNTTAVRNFVEFNHGLILSADPLPDDVIFEVCIDRKVNVWNGSLEIGVTTNDPEYMDLPATATKLRNTAWIMSGCSVVRDGVTLINDYGPELDSLHEGELLGVMRSSKGDLSFYVNGRCLGVAAEGIPDRVFAVIDLYGQCVQVTIVSPNYRRLEDPGMESINEGIEMLQTMDSLVDLPMPSTSNAVLAIRENLHIPITSNVEAETLGEGADLYNNDWQAPRQPRDTHSDSSGSGDPDQDVMSDRCTDDDSREDRYDSIARGVRDAHLDSNVTSGRREDTPQGRCRVGMLYDWHLDQLTPYTGEMGTTSQFDNSLSEVSEAGLTSEESEAMVDEIRAVENRIVETIITMPDDDSDIVAQDKLRFHPRCGFLVKLSSNYRTAERTRPLDDYNNGVVMTHRPLRDDELFEIRIDQLVDKWSGSIEMGVTHHNPATIRYPSTMTNMDTGTIMMSGCKVLLNGHGTCLEYGNVNLDELREGDRVGVVRRSNGQLHYVINGVEQGVAAERVRPPVWGVVDLYGMTVKVTVQDTSEPTADSNICELPPAAVATTPVARPEDHCDSSRTRRQIDEESLLFHSLRDSHVTIINDGKTAHRPNAFEYFHNGIVMTNRTLRPNEQFQVRLDLVIPKWAGSIEIGVTQHPSSDLKFPFRVSTATTGTWVLAGEDIVHNSNVIIPKYVRHLSRLKEGDTVGLARKHDGTLHFYINGADQGPAAFNVPEQVFGIVDLYGRVAQVTIADSYRPAPLAPFSPESLASSDSNATVYPEMCFHRVHGRNARLSRTRLTASRTAVYSEFNDAVLFSSRPLRECDMFELRIDAMVDCWIGSLEIGVTAIRPEDLESNGSIGSLAGTATDLNCDTYILSGAAMMKDGECVKSGYPLDLDTLSVGSRVGMMWHADRSIHYYLDGMDMGKAWYVPHLNIYAVVDLYGQCTQVTILQNEERTFNYNGRSNSDSLISSSRAIESPPPPYWSFSEYCGENIKLMQDYSYAQRLNNDPMGALVFSSAHLAIEEIFEIKIIDCMQSYSGNLRMGVTDVNILNAHVNRHMPPSVNFLPHFTAYIDGRYMRYSRPGSREQETAIVTPSFEWLRAGDRVGLKRVADGRVLVYMNGDALDACFENVPDKVYVVMEIYGRTTKIQAVSKSANTGPALQPAFANDAYYTASRFDENEAIQALYKIDVVNCLDRQSDEESAETKEPLPQEGSSSCDSDEAPPDMYMDLGVCSPPMVREEEEQFPRLPYTFHAVHAMNIRLLASNTVARRVTGYDYGIAAVSSPLRRGQTCWFRIDEVDTKFCGGLSIGAMVSLPTVYLPHNAFMLGKPSWVLSAELVQTNGILLRNQTINLLETLEEGQAVGVRFELSGDIVILADRKEQFYPIIEKVDKIGNATEYTEIYPLIDLYGPIVQVSLTIHQNYVSLNSFAKEGVSPLKRNMKNIFDPTLIKYLVDRGMAYTTNKPPCIFYKALTPMPNFYTTPDALGVRIPGPLDDDVFISELSRSLSLQNIPKKSDFVGSIKPYFSHGVRMDDDVHVISVTPQWALQNDPMRLSEVSMQELASDITSVTLEHLPEITDQTSLYLGDNSTCHAYFSHILNPDREDSESTSSEGEWEGNDNDCEHLGVVLQYWRTLSGSYPALHRAASWGHIKCYCIDCEPNNTSSLSGWVRIERIDGVGAASRGFWHINKAALSVLDAAGAPSRRPAAILSGLNVNMPAFDMWFDEKGTPHVITLAMEIDTEGPDAASDRLLAILLYVREPTLAEDSDGA